MTTQNTVSLQSPKSTAELLSETAMTFRRHLIISEPQADVLAAWCVHTWVYERFQHTPRLAIISPQKRCGKSTLIDLLKAFCRSPLKADSASEAAIFRSIEKHGPLTLLLDEADSFLPQHPGLRNVINSGYEASGATLRAVKVKDDHDPQAFKTFCPAALASIGELPETIADRAIPIRLRRKTDDESVKKVRHHRKEHGELAARIAEWAAAVDLSAHLEPDVPDDFNDRQADISVPLLAIADEAGGEWPERARSALAELFQRNEAESTEAKLLTDLRTLFDQAAADRLASADICESLAKMEERPWSDMGHGRAITAAQIARLLEPFGISPGNMRDGEKVLKGYQRSDFTEAWRRYLPVAEAATVAA